MNEDEVLATVIDRVEPALTADLSVIARGRALKDLRADLAAELKGIPAEGWEWFANAIATSLIEEIDGMPATERSRHFAGRLVVRRLHELDQAARSLAEEHMPAEPNGSVDPSAEALAEGAAIQEQLQALSSEFNEHWPAFGERYDRMFSEALLDCGYVLSEGRVASLRVGRQLRRMRQ